MIEKNRTERMPITADVDDTPSLGWDYTADLESINLKKELICQ